MNKTLCKLLLLLPLALFACGGDDDIEFGKKTDDSDLSITTDVSARMETPATRTDGSTIVVAHSTTIGGRKVITYAYEFDKNLYHSRWVAFRFDGDTRAKNVSRSNEGFQDDPSLSYSLRVGGGWFRGYNRGHLCASADRLYSAEANEQTFYMSNMSPQLSSFNQGYWVTLEGQVQSRGRDASFADTLYVVKGGTITSGDILGYTTVQKDGASVTGTKRIPVPKYYYMALLKVKNGQYQSIGFWLDHKEYGYSYANKAPASVIATHAVSINRLEDYTGIDFFPNLPDDIEETIEEQCVTSNWIK